MTRTLTRTWKTASGVLVLMVLPVAPIYAVGAAGADSAAERTETSQEARRTVQAALDVVRKMQADPQLWSLAERAAGIFIVPDYARAGLVVGGRGGQGVLLARQDGGWSGPAFYNIGGVSAGAEAGVEAGEIAMLLMDERTLEEFATESNFTLSAEAGLAIADYSTRAQANADADLIVWSSTKGAFANASVAVTNVFWDEAENQAYHGKAVTPRELLDGPPPPGQRVEELLALR